MAFLAEQMTGTNDHFFRGNAGRGLGAYAPGPLFPILGGDNP
jgi:hypothetical protein